MSVHKKFIFFSVLVVLLGVAGYIGYDVWRTHHTTEQILLDPSRSLSNRTEWTQDEEGKDESNPPGNHLDDYKVSAALPRVLRIDALSVAARVLPMGLNKDQTIQAPINIFDTGWYANSAQPGEEGAVFIDGHASGATRQGLFAYLDTLTEGAEVRLEKGDGETLTYKVVHVESVPLATIDMKKVLAPYEGVRRGLNLMTCTGTWLPAEKTYDHRVVVYTEQV